MISTARPLRVGVSLRGRQAAALLTEARAAASLCRFLSCCFLARDAACTPPRALPSARAEQHAAGTDATDAGDAVAAASSAPSSPRHRHVRGGHRRHPLARLQVPADLRAGRPDPPGAAGEQRPLLVDCGLRCVNRPAREVDRGHQRPARPRAARDEP
eukprot:7386836-Prymnesium_polylepis.1